MNRSARAELAVELAPLAPPCFSSRGQWVEYVSAAARAQATDHAPGPLLFERGRPVRFNPAFDVCEDCDDRHAAHMKHQGKCRPRYLNELLAPAPARATA